MRGRLAVVACLVVAAAFGAVPGREPLAVAQGPAVPQPVDYCDARCQDILTPGANGNASLTDILGNQLLGLQPPHADDQLDRYASLVGGYTGLTGRTLGDFFNDASFGVPEEQVERVDRPRADVKIVRDRATGVPHVYGSTRSGTEFGAGYAAAQDRLWIMDVFRHVGRGSLTGFAGGAADNRELEQTFWRQAPYTEADLRAQIDRVASSGPRGRQALADVESYVDGVNSYIARAARRGGLPGEYLLTGNADLLAGNGGVEDFTPTDLVAIAAVVGGLFGTGGGGEVTSALVKLAAQERYGAAEGERVWRAFRAQNDAEAVTTVHDGTRFDYAASPRRPRAVAMPDPDSVTPQRLAYDATGSARRAGTADSGVLPGGLLSRQHGMSNALVVSGEHAAGGHPVAVFGPQTGYFAPQLLMLQELHGPGIHARGASFAGLNFYVQLGRGQDYAWSATSAAQDVTDTYAVELCGRESYRYRGDCVPMQRLEVRNDWAPSLADQTPPGGYTLRVLRTHYGLVQSRGTVDGRPVAFTSKRSSYGHEVDSIIGFQKFNDPAAITSAADFQRAAADINYTFNWFYVDSEDTAYVNSGANPVRPSGVDPNLPIHARRDTEWRGVTPDAEHPQSVNQDYYVSWNNKQAPGYTSAGFGEGSVHRGDLLDDRVAALVDGGGVDRAALTRVMAEAGVTDLRGEHVLPELLAVIGDADAPGVAELRAWLADGARRVETEPGSRAYAHAEAIRIMDAWWPRLVSGIFAAPLGDELYSALTEALAVDEPPHSVPGVDGGIQGGGHTGSAFQHGWWSYVDKDLRATLGQPVRSPLAGRYCGEPAACRQVLLDTLAAATATPAGEVYQQDSSCAAGEQWCADALVHRPLGGISHRMVSWQNRPTYQQVVQFPRHR